MAANTSPIFVEAVKNGFTIATTANTALDGTGTLGTDIFLLLTADATDGNLVDRIIISHKGTNSATVMRFFVNNGSTNGTATNNVLVHEETVAANTLSQVAASVAVIWNCNLKLQPGYRILVTVGTSASAGLHVYCEGGNF